MNTGNQPQLNNENNSKTIAIISYLTPVGWIIAYIMYTSNKSTFAVYHLRQTLLLMFISLGVYVVQTMLLFIPYMGWLITMLSIVVNIGLLVLWVIGLITAINGEEKPIPLIGEKAQLLFAKIV